MSDYKTKLREAQDLIDGLCKYSKQQLGFNRDPKVIFLVNEENSIDPLGKTGYYLPDENKIVIYVANRHIKDILRSLSHELVHHAQNCRGDFANINSTNEGYAQADPHLREMEREAYEKGNLIFRDFEDTIKQKT